MSVGEFAEMPLWRVLDEHGFQFRRTYKDLISEHSLTDTDPWDSDRCFAGFGQQRDLIEGLARPMHFVFYQGSRDSQNFPRRIEGCIRQSDDAYENYKMAVEQLAGLFGVGLEQTDLSSISRTWSFGGADIVARIFPPDRNKPDPHNDRHRLDPDSVTECSVTIETAFCPAPNEREMEAITKVKMIENSPDMPFVKNGPQWSEYTRRLNSDPWPDGFGFGCGPADKSGSAYSDQYFIHRSASGYFEVIPRNLVGGVQYHQSVPDRGMGNVRVCIGYGTSSGNRHELTLLQAGYERDIYRDFAIRLSHKLFTSYTETQTPFCDLPPEP